MYSWQRQHNGEWGTKGSKNRFNTWIAAEVAMDKWGNTVADIIHGALLILDPWILGMSLILSPWLFHFAPGVESWNAWAGGGVVAILSIAALFDSTEWMEWLSLIVGLWILVSPWVLKFPGSTDAMRTDAFFGLIIAAIAAMELWMFHRSPPRPTAS